MAATVIVELSGDERRVLEAYRKTEEADKKLRDATAQTGAAGRAASKQFADAWVEAGKGSQVGIQSLIKQLRQSGDEGALAAKRLTTEMQRSGVDSESAFQAVIDKLKATDPEAAKAARRIRFEMAQAAEQAKQALIEADKAAEFKSTIDSLRKLGPEGAEIAKGIQQRMEQAAAASAGSMDQMIAKLAQLNPVAAEAAAKIKVEMADAAAKAKVELAEADQASQFKATMDALRKLGPEGAKVAAGIQKDLDRAAAMSVGSIDQIIGKLGQINPAAAAAADKIKQEIAQADAATNFDNSIAELRKINPEAAKAAEAVREKMELADAGVKFDNIIAELKKVDPVAAAEAAKMRQHMKTVANDSGGAFKSFAGSSIGHITSVSGAITLLGTGLLRVNTYLQDQAKLAEAAMNKQGELAASQQESFKNLLAFKAVERDELLQKAAPEIARRTGVSSAVISLALGEAASAGATPEEAKLAAGAAAELNRLTPAKTADSAAGIASVMIQTGLSDPRQAAALLATAGPLSKVGDAEQLAISLPKALASVATVPQQDPAEAARELAAIFGVVSNRAVDNKGDASSTFIGKFMGEVRTMFSGMEDRRIDARSKVELIDRKIEGGTDTEANRRDRENLLRFLKETEGFKDPGTILGRLELLQQNEGMKQELIGKSGQLGEQQFQVVLQELLLASSQSAQSLRDFKGQIRSDVGYFNDTVKALTNATPQTRGEAFIRSGEVSIETTQVKDIEAARLAQIRKRVSDELKQAGVGGVGGFANAFFDEGIELPLIGQVGGITEGSLSGGTFAEEAVSGIAAIRGRIGMMQADGVTEQEKLKIEQLQFAIGDITKLLEEDTRSAVISRDSVTAAIQELETIRDAWARENQDEEAEFYNKVVDSLNLALSQRVNPVAVAVSANAGDQPITRPQSVGEVTIGGNTTPIVPTPIKAEQTGDAPIAAPVVPAPVTMQEVTIGGDTTPIIPQATKADTGDQLIAPPAIVSPVVAASPVTNEIVPIVPPVVTETTQGNQPISRPVEDPIPVERPTPIDPSKQPVAPIGDPNAPQAETNRRRVMRNGVAVIETDYAPDPAFVERQIAALDKQNNLVEEQNRLIEQQNALLAETADNTRPTSPSPPNYDAIYNTANEEADAR